MRSFSAGRLFMPTVWYSFLRSFFRDARFQGLWSLHGSRRGPMLQVFAISHVRLLCIAYLCRFLCRSQLLKGQNLVCHLEQWMLVNRLSMFWERLSREASWESMREETHPAYQAKDTIFTLLVETLPRRSERQQSMGSGQLLGIRARRHNLWLILCRMTIIGTNTKKEIDQSQKSEGAKKKGYSFLERVQGIVRPWSAVL